MNKNQLFAAFCAAACLTACFTGCTSERGTTSTADIEEAVTTPEDSDAETTTEAVTTTTAPDTTTTAETTATDAESDSDADTTTTAAETVSAANNIILTHITEGGEGLGVFHNLSGAIRGAIMKEHTDDYKNWKLDSFSGHAEEDDTVAEAAASFTYGDAAGFSVNGTVEVLPADDPDYPNKMYFHSDDVDAFPRFMNDNRGEARKAKFIIENSSDVYRMLDKNDPPEETAFSVSITVNTVTVRYSQDGTAYDTIHVTAASNR